MQHTHWSSTVDPDNENLYAMLITSEGAESRSSISVSVTTKLVGEVRHIYGMVILYDSQTMNEDDVFSAIACVPGLPAAFVNVFLENQGAFVEIENSAMTPPMGVLAFAVGGLQAYYDSVKTAVRQLAENQTLVRGGSAFVKITLQSNPPAP